MNKVNIWYCLIFLVVLVPLSKMFYYALLDFGIAESEALRGMASIAGFGGLIVGYFSRKSR